MDCEKLPQWKTNCWVHITLKGYMIYHSAWSLVWFTCTQAKETVTKIVLFHSLYSPQYSAIPWKGKECHEVTVGLHSITDGRIKPCCLGGWYMAAQIELNVSFLSSYPIQRGFCIFLSSRRDQGAKQQNDSVCTDPCSGLEAPSTYCDSAGRATRTAVLDKLLTLRHLGSYEMLENI